MLGSDLLLLLKSAHEVIGKGSRDFDISSSGDCRRLVTETRPDIVINASAYTDVDGCETNRDKCFAVNAEGVKNLVLACQGNNIKIVHFSTDYVFAGTSATPYREDAPYQPINTYGKSKMAGERYIVGLTANYLLVRTSWLYGRQGRNFVKTILEKAATAGPLKVVDDQVGSPTYTVDLAGAVKELVQGGHQGIFHVANGGSCSWYDFARAILADAGVTGVEILPIKSHKLKRAAKRPNFSIFDCSKFHLATGMTMRPWRKALRDFLENL